MLYQQQIETLTQQIKTSEKKYRIISMLRLAAFISAAAGLGMVYYFEITVAGWIVTCTGIILFILLVFLHHQIAEKKRFLQLLHGINTDSLSRTNGEWIRFRDSGDEYTNLDHPYSRDLDIFGPGSLFQLINVTNTPGGRLRLKTTLEKPYQSARDIQLMQEAVTELAQKLDWRQRFQAEGIRFNDGNNATVSYADMATEKPLFVNTKINFIIRFLPAALCASIAAAVFIDGIPVSLPMTVIVLQMLMIGIFFKKTNLIIGRLLRYRTIVKIYKILIECIEQENFSSAYLSELKNELLSQKGKTASAQIKQLETLTDIISMRVSIIHFPVNVLTMLDMQCALSFEKWMAQSGIHFERWVDAVAKMETVSSLSLLRYDNPQWCMPVLHEDTESFVISVSGAAHPLIEKKYSVPNDFTSDRKGRINIITGSNMSGKSTFLRTIALNMVLAYAGAPVCARAMECSLMKIYTSMRIIDNLGKHVSSFYAELLRIKMIIEQSKEKEKIFFALDELFRGTNSRDRILGARAVIKNLGTENVAGMISTHDLELTELEKDKTTDIVNYHFRETYEQDGILFDYTLYNGVSTTSDAVYLMKKAGIEI